MAQVSLSNSVLHISVSSGNDGTASTEIVTGLLGQRIYSVKGGGAGLFSLSDAGVYDGCRLVDFVVATPTAHPGIARWQPQSRL